MTSAHISTRGVNPAAALWLATFALFTMTAMNAIIHEAAKVAPVGQLVFWRSFVALGPILIYLLVRRELGMSLRTKYPHKHLIRGVLGAGVMMFNFIALAYLSVGLATAISYLTPILSICAAMVFLRERPGAAVITGVVIGLVGIVLMLFPALVGTEVRQGTLIGVAAGLAMAATNALSRVQVKDLTRTDPPASIALSFAVVSSLVGLATLAFGWAELDSQTLMLLIGAGLLGGMGHILMTEAVARAPVSLLAGYEYTGIIWAFLFDVALLGVVLDVWSVAGALVVVAAAALVAYGQGRFSRQSASPVRTER
ncbi:DMT family transporter [Devosia sp. 2618]|uniref:DMT family transporter n=1 Tax=Devosia sp. 2618 TaxID=3156454 RepID=UPI00339729C0